MKAEHEKLTNLPFFSNSALIDQNISIGTKKGEDRMQDM